MATSLFEQCNDSDVMAAAMICGIEPVTPTFRIVLKAHAPLPGKPTIGDIACAYLRAKLAELEGISADAAARPKKIKTRPGLPAGHIETTNA